MCLICGELQTHIHWTELRPGVGASEIAEAGGEAEKTRRRDRIRRITLLNQVLSLFGLMVSDWEGVSYVLSNRKGDALLLRDLGALWSAVEKMIGRPIDPLDPALLARVESMRKYVEGGGK